MGCPEPLPCAQDRHEVWREVAAVELHTFNNFKLSFHSTSFFNCDDAFFTYLLPSLLQGCYRWSVAVCRDGTNLSDFLGILGALREA